MSNVRASTRFDGGQNVAGLVSRKVSAARDSFSAANADLADRAEFCAVLVLDASGKVVAANSSARRLWTAVDKSLVGLPFAWLFRLDGDSAELEFCDSRWKAMKTSALDCWTQLAAQPLDGLPCDVRVRLERALGGAGSYIATIQPHRPGR